MIIYIFAVVHPLREFVYVVLAEHALLAAHQGKTARQDNKVIWNTIKMIWRQLGIGLIVFVPLCTLCRRF